MKTAQMLHSGSCRLNHTPNEQRNGRHKIPAACRAAASLAACSASLAACCVLSFANHGNAQSKDGQENTAEYRREREIERERERERERGSRNREQNVFPITPMDSYSAPSGRGQQIPSTAASFASWHLAFNSNSALKLASSVHHKQTRR